jgi:single-stranded-DNA-specific exonuclease
LSTISNLLESYGGHAMAAGFVAKTERLAEIEERLSELFWQQFDKETLRPVVNIDAALRPDELSWETFDILQQFEPTGMGNPRPVFMLSDLQVVDYRAVGAEGKHVKLTLKPAPSVQRPASSGRQSGLPEIPQSIEAIAFNFGHWVEELAKKPVIDVAFGLDKNEWNGRKTLQLMVKDMRLAEKN